jgi:hypothetical protein
MTSGRAQLAGCGVARDHLAFEDRLPRTKTGLQQLNHPKLVLTRSCRR